MNLQYVPVFVLCVSLHFSFALSAAVDCITEHAKFRIVCLDTDVLNTALVGIHNARCKMPDPIENRSVSKTQQV